MRLIQKVAAGMAIAGLLIPAGAAFAHDNSGDTTNRNGFFTRLEERFGAKHNEDNDKNEDRDMNGRDDHPFVSANSAHNGVVTAKGSNSFTMTAGNGNSYTVDTTNATITRVMRSTIALADISVGDRVWVKGDVTGQTIKATQIFDLEVNKHPVKATGTVTAVDGNNLTVDTKNHGTVTVTTSADTKVTNNDGQAATTADITTGSQIKIKGLWDSVLNVLQAFFIHIK